MGCVSSKDDGRSKTQQGRRKSTAGGKKKKKGMKSKKSAKALKNERQEEALVNFSALEDNIEVVQTSSAQGDSDEEEPRSRGRKKLRNSQLENSGRKGEPGKLSNSGNKKRERDLGNSGNKGTTATTKFSEGAAAAERSYPSQSGTKSSAEEDPEARSKLPQVFTVAIAGGAGLQRRVSSHPYSATGESEAAPQIKSSLSIQQPGLVTGESGGESGGGGVTVQQESTSRSNHPATTLSSSEVKSPPIIAKRLSFNRDAFTDAQRAKVAEVAAKRRSLEARLMKGTIVGLAPTNPKVRPSLPKPSKDVTGSSNSAFKKKGVVMASNTSIRTNSSARSTVSSNVRSLGSENLADFTVESRISAEISNELSTGTGIGLFEVIDRDERALLKLEDCATCECPSIDTLLEFSTQFQRNQWVEWGMLIHTVNLGGFKRVSMNRWFANCGKEQLTHTVIAAATDLSNVSTSNSSRGGSSVGSSSIGGSSVGSTDAPLPGMRNGHNNNKSLETNSSGGSVKTAENLNSALTVRNLQQNEKLINRIEARRTKKELQALTQRAGRGSGAINPLLTMMTSASALVHLNQNHSISEHSSSVFGSGEEEDSSGGTFESSGGGSNVSDLMELETERVAIEGIKRRDSQLVV